MTVTPWLQAIEDRIAEAGSITIAEYMSLCADAYYARGNVFGRGGDFITAPEISQTFGEIIGLWCAVTWQAMGQPKPFRLIECGPGRGTLMADALRATQRITGFHEAAQIHLVERSESLRAAQRKALGDANVHWHADLATVPRGPTILVANEFLDALSIRQFQRTTMGWAERVIVRELNGSLAFATRPVHDAPVPIALAATAEIGSVFERSDSIVTFTSSLARRLAADGGAALLIDYGHATTALGDTLQAVKAHRYHDVLADPGEADITAHVDFAAVAQAVRTQNAAVFGPMEQGAWLRRLGIAVRQVQLAKGKTPDQARTIEQGVRRLTDPHGMGLLFKVMAIAHPALTSLEGFMPESSS